MSSLTITNNFTNSTTADAEEVDANFTDVKDFVDSHCVHKDETALEAKSGSPGNKFQFDSNTIDTVVGQADVSKIIPFGTAFATTPKVFVTSAQGGGGTKVGVFTVSDVTTTSFKVWWRSSDLNGPSGVVTYTFYWFAVGT